MIFNCDASPGTILTTKDILFFAAWPMLAGLSALFLLRHEDRIASFGGGKSRAKASQGGY